MCLANRRTPPSSPTTRGSTPFPSAAPALPSIASSAKPASARASAPSSSVQRWSVYGPGRGLTPDSDQIPKLTRYSRERGAGLYIGKGLNRWSNVYIDDLVSLYQLALEKAPAASFFFAENGENALKEVATSVSRALGFGGKTESWKAEDALKAEGDWARFALGSNSRVRAVNARRLLGWSPQGPTLAEAVEQGI